MCAIINTQELEKRRSYSHSMSGKLYALSMFTSTQLSKFKKTSDVLSLICKNDLNCKKVSLNRSLYSKNISMILSLHFKLKLSYNFNHDRT